MKRVEVDIDPVRCVLPDLYDSLATGGWRVIFLEKDLHIGSNHAIMLMLGITRDPGRPDFWKPIYWSLFGGKSGVSVRPRLRIPSHRNVPGRLNRAR